MPGRRCFQVHPEDNVATTLDDVEPHAPVQVLNGRSMDQVEAREAIGLGHKIALVDISSGSAIIKYGVAIGSASQPIQAGEWVHLHNCSSGCDTRSQTLDVHTGSATDTRYE